MKKSAAVLFVLINLFLACFFLDMRIGPNAASRALPVISLLKDGQWSFDPYEQLTIDKGFSNGHYYTDKAPLSSWLITPFAAVFFKDQVNLLKTTFGNVILVLAQFIALGSFLAASLPFLFMVLLSFWSVRGRQARGLPATVLVMLSWYGSYIFVYSGVYYGHLLAGIFLLLSYLDWEKGRFFRSGLLMGAVFLSEYPVVIAAAAWMGSELLEKRRIPVFKSFLLGMLPGVLLMGIYNWSLTGIPWQMVYAFHSSPLYGNLHSFYGFRLPSWEGVTGLLFSPHRGVVWHNPILFVFLAGLLIGLWKQRNWKSVIKHRLFLVSVLYFFLIASFSYWEGGLCYGPRYLLPLIVLWVFEGVRQYQASFWMNLVFFILGGIGWVLIWIVRSTEGYNFPERIKDFPWMTYYIPLFTSGNFGRDHLAASWFEWDGAGPPILWAAVFLVFSAFQWKQPVSDRKPG